MTDWALPPSLKRTAPLFVDTPAVRSAVEAVFAGADAGGFTVYLDNACGMPADWKSFTYSKRATGQFTGRRPAMAGKLRPQRAAAAGVSAMDMKKIIVLGGDGFCGWPATLHLADPVSRVCAGA